MAPKTEVAAKATFTTDDKRAQYARLAVFNFAVSEKMVGKDSDVNSVSDSILVKSVDSLAGGNLLDGKDGVELIQKLTKNGATDPEVAKRGLTVAYAQEVRPFIRRKTLSEQFGRRSKPRAEKPAAEKKESKAPVAKKAPAAAKKKSTKRSSAKSA